MERVFQHYKGKIKALTGVSFACVKSIHDVVDNEVVLLWLQDKNSPQWYRIFIDGTYCGIDRYTEDNSENDLDDDIICKDHSQWFEGKELKEAEVLYDNGPNRHIVLTLNFGCTNFSLVCKAEEGECILEFA